MPWDNIRLPAPQELFRIFFDRSPIMVGFPQRDPEPSPTVKDTMTITSGGLRLLPPIDLINTTQGTVVGTAKGTGYYPADDPIEGGFHDKKGRDLRTLQDFLEGKVDYVSIALDKNLYKQGIVKYGDKFRIPELEEKYGRPIEFRAVDTGGAFTNKRFSRVDICVRNRRESYDRTINGQLTLIKM